MLHTPLALALALVSAADPAPLYVIGDVVHVRAAAARDAPSVARLRINTAVAPTGPARGEWTAVSLAPGGRADVVGYVASALLAATPLTREDAALRANDAARHGDAAAAALWAERGKLIELRFDVEDDAKSPVWLAHCDGTRVVLLGLEDGKRLRPLTREHDEPLSPSFDEAARAVVAAQWYRPDAALEGTPFPTPFGAPLWNDETKALPPAPGTQLDTMKNSGVAPMPLDRAEKLVLGPCGGSERGLWATAPLSRERLRGLPVAAALERSRALFERCSSRGVPSEGLPDVPAAPTLLRSETWRIFGGSYVLTSVSVDAVWTDEDTRRSARSAFVISDDDGRDATGVTPWAGGAEQLRLYRSGRLLLVLPVAATREGGATGFVIATPRADKVDATLVVTDRAGC